MNHSCFPELLSPELLAALNAVSDAMPEMTSWQQDSQAWGHAAWLPLFALKRDGFVVGATPLLTELLGYTTEQLEGQKVSLLLYSGLERLRLRLVGEQMYHSQGIADLEIIFNHYTGEARPLLVRVMPWEKCVVIACLWPEALQAQRGWVGDQPTFLYSLLDNMQISIAILDPDGRYMYCNPKAIRNDEIRAWIIGRTDEEYVAYRGHPPEMVKNRKECFQRAIEEKRAVAFEETMRTRDGSLVFEMRIYTPIFHANGSLAYMVGHGVDLTALRIAESKLKQLNEQLEIRILERTHRAEQLAQELQYQAYHDPLTGLANRFSITKELEMTLQEGKSYAMLYLDTDRFKAINDTFGHLAGDEVLKEIGHRLSSVFTDGAMVGRLSGDEFIILVRPALSRDQIPKQVAKLQEALHVPMRVSGLEVIVSVSIGIAISDPCHPRVNASDVLRDADIAMYRAKGAGRDGYMVFEEWMLEEAVGRNMLANDLRVALGNDELEVAYQPIVRLQTGKVTGFEALARWNHQTRGAVSPAEFIPIAEESGLLLQMDHWVLRRACCDMVEWQEKMGGEPLTLSVNFSARHFVGTSFYEQICQTLAQTGFSPSLLHLEITEGVLLEHRDTVLSTLQKLSELGVHLHIDDFGTGYSSLSYLHTYPLDTLKIDRSFVQDMLTHASSAELVKTIVFMAQNMQMEVVAEGIETTEQLEQLMELNCTYGQGYFFAKPLPIEQAFERVRALKKEIVK